MEVYGECPTAIAKLGGAYITGMQHGDVGSPKTDILLVAASPKHFTDYSLECSCFRGKSGCDPENPRAGCKAPNGIGRNAYDANVSAHDMRETYLAGWKAAVGAGIQGLMCSSNAVNGVPLCAHADLLNGIMRQEFGMSGAVISDGNGVTDLYHQPDMNGNNPINGKGIPGHEYAHSWPAAAADALKAGCDMSWDEDLPPQVRMGGALNGTIKQALRLKLTTMDAVKAAAAHTLLPRFRVGIFDEANATVQNPWKEIPASVIQSDAHTLLAKRAAAESMTLLRCDSGVLPVRRDAAKVMVIGVIGAAANSSTLSIDRYNGHPDAAHISTFESGISAAAGSAGATVVACVASAPATACAAHLKQHRAGIVVLVTTGHQEGEQHDRADLGVVQDDIDLLQAVHVALPMVSKVLVVVSGGAVSTEQVDQLVNATIWAGKGGMQAGAGFASLLFGVQDFSGRVAATVYRRAWVNASDMMDSAISGGAQPRGYRYLSPAATTAYVQYGFGHGQSLQKYSAAFNQSHYSVSAAALSAGGNVSVGITVSVADTISNMQAIRSVLLFVSGGEGAAPEAPLPRRQEWLGDFEKVRISGGTATMALSLDREAVQRWIPTSGGASATSFIDGRYVVQKGGYILRLTDGVAIATLSVV
jgi:beta-glucosidase-like glycosyl hydrolase